MNVLRRTWAIFVIVTKRLFSQRWLALMTAVGLLTSVALTVSIPLYADAIYYRVLREELAGDRFGSRPPFVFMFRYVGAWAGPVEWDEVQPLDTYMTGSAGAALGLPQKSIVRYFETDNFQLFPEEDIAYADTRDPLAWVNFAFASDMANHITILEGNYPAAAASSQDSTIEMLMSEALATEAGFQVGETYMAYVRRRTETREQTLQIPVRIAGIWQATDPVEEYWFYDPKALDQTMLVPEETFMGRLSPYMEDEIYLGLWYLVMDGSEVYASDVDSLLIRTTSVQQRTGSLLPETRLDVSPVPALQAYRRATTLLTFLLYAFSVPIVGLVLSFIGLVVGLAVGRQRRFRSLASRLWKACYWAHLRWVPVCLAGRRSPV